MYIIYTYIYVYIYIHGIYIVNIYEIIHIYTQAGVAAGRGGVAPLHTAAHAATHAATHGVAAGRGATAHTPTLPANAAASPAAAAPQQSHAQGRQIQKSLH